MEDVNEIFGKLYKTEALAFFPEDPPKNRWEEVRSLKKKCDLGEI